MKIIDIANLIQGKIVSENKQDDREITSAYCCDMLSLVMKNAQADMALITIQTNMNAVAVCVLMESPVMILAEGIKIEEKSLEKANEEDISIIETALSSYEICGLLYQAGIPSVPIK